MKKFIVLILLVLTFLEAGSFKRELISDKFISKNKSEYINSNQYSFGKEIFENVSIKLNINKEVLKKKNYYVRVTCDVNSIVYSNVPYEVNFDTIIFKLDEKSPDNIYFDFEYKNPKKLNFRVFILNDFEYKYVIKKEGLIFGIAYGIIFCAFLYNFVIFIYTFQRSFLYYCLMQICLLVVLVDVSEIATLTYLTKSEKMFIDFFETLCILFTLLFSKEILNTRKTLKKMNSLLNFLIYLNVVDLFAIFIFNVSVLYEFLARSVVIFILIVIGFMALYKGQKTAGFYIAGWFVLFISLLLAEYELIGIDTLYIIHIGLPIESLILSFALGYKLKQTVEEKKEKEKILVHQSKLASMGEMINNIAHQWRQPLAHLSFINMDLQMASEDNDLNKKYLIEKLDESNNQIDFMSQTIDNFKNFYHPRKKKEFFYISNATQNAIDIIKPSLDYSSIKLQFKIEEDKKIRAYENEYQQVILNFLTNAKDVLLERKIENPQIEVLLEVKNNKSILSVSDNAGGIKADVIEKIFEPYFTTKDKSSGIGLYMSKTIVQSHLKGNIVVKNKALGACFSVEV